MSWKIVRSAAVAVVTAALLAAWLLWLRITPSLSPDDVTLRGKLLPTAGLAGAQAADGEAWAAQLQVQRSKPGAADDDIVYLYVPSYQGTKYEIVEDNRPDAVSMIDTAAIRTQVRNMLQQTGISVFEAELSEPGLSYTGRLPSYTVRAYLKPRPSSAASPSATAPSKAAPAAGTPAASSKALTSFIVLDGSAYAVYIHQERRYGKNVGWTKAVRLEPPQQQ